MGNFLDGMEFLGGDGISAVKISQRLSRCLNVLILFTRRPSETIISVSDPSGWGSAYSAESDAMPLLGAAAYSSSIDKEDPWGFWKVGYGIFSRVTIRFYYLRFFIVI